MSLDYQRYYEDGWKNKPDRSTPVVAEALNSIDDAIIETQEAIKGIGGKNVASAKMSTGQITDAFDGSAIVTDFTRNLIKYPYDRVSGYVSQGVTYTYDEDGTTYANGTASANSNGFSYILKTSNFVLKKGRYKLYGSQSGNSSTFFQRIYLYNLDGSNLTNYTDYGSGVEFETEIDCLVEIKPYIVSGYTANNIVFKPVLIEITEGKEIPTEYIPTSGYDVRLCTENFMPFPYYHENGKQLNGITWTYDENGVLYANGTASSNSAFLIADDSQKVVIPKGSYKMTGCPSGGSGSTYRMRLYVAEATSQYAVGQTFTDSGSGADFEFVEDTICRIYPQVMSGYNAQNLVFQPMIVFEDSETEYVPPKSKTVHVDSKSELPVLGLETYEGITNVISPFEISFDYATSKDGGYILDGYSIAKQNERKLSDIDALMTTMLDEEV